MPIFQPPTVEEGPAGGGPLFGRYKLTRGVTVLKNAGVYTEHRYPSQAQVDAADIAYIGGYRHVVSDTEATALTNAGYGGNLSG